MDPPESVHIGGEQRDIESAGAGGNPQVVGANELVPLFQFGEQRGVLAGYLARNAAIVCAS
jgi:hypothetical protein